MRKPTLIADLKYKAFQSNNPLYLFIAINVLLFLAIHVVRLLGVFGLFPAGWDGYFLWFFQLPASFGDAVYRPWTLLTYMFTQVGFFHLLFNMLWLFWMGQIFMDFLSRRQFIGVYLLGGLVGALMFLLAYNLLPFFEPYRFSHVLIGSSASVSAVIFAIATLVPNYSIRMLFFGNVKLKYLALVFIILDVLGLGGSNTGGSIAHIGGAIFGFIYIKQLQKGNDFSEIFKLKRKKRLKVVRSKAAGRGGGQPGSQNFGPTAVNQDEIDKILDKISQNGYDSLTKSEKELLFKASKQEQSD